MAAAGSVRRAAKPLRRKPPGRRMLARMGGIDPIVVSVDVPSTPERAFEAFAAGFADWWPVVDALAVAQRRDALPARRDAGRVVEERAPDGARHLWGTVESVEPGRRLRFTWHPGREPESAQWVDVDFARGRDRHPRHADARRLGSARRDRAHPAPRVRVGLAARARKRLRGIRRPRRLGSRLRARARRPSGPVRPSRQARARRRSAPSAETRSRASACRPARRWRGAGSPSARMRRTRSELPSGDDSTQLTTALPSSSSTTSTRPSGLPSSTVTGAPKLAPASVENASLTRGTSLAAVNQATATRRPCAATAGR